MAKPHEITESDGGGGVVTLEGTRDINLMRRAITERWPVNPARMQAYMAALDRVIETSEDDRALVAAVSTLIAADRANVAAFLAALKEVNGEGTTNNTQINNTIDLSGLTVEQLRALAGRGDNDAS